MLLFILGFSTAHLIILTAQIIISHLNSDCFHIELVGIRTQDLLILLYLLHVRPEATSSKYVFQKKKLVQPSF